MTIGDRIKSLRLQKGMSQEELGGKVGVKKAAINKYEKGIVVNLKQSVISKLADALDVSPVYLMGFDEDQLPYNTEKGYKAKYNRAVKYFGDEPIKKDYTFFCPGLYQIPSFPRVCVQNGGAPPFGFAAYSGYGCIFRGNPG